MGGKGSQSTQNTVYAGIQIQTSGYGKSDVLIFGTQRTSGDLLDYTDFQQIAQQQQGGKGGGGKNGGTSYDYKATVLVSLCKGNITGIKNVWNTSGKLAIFDGSTTYTVPSGGGAFTVFPPSSGTYYADNGVGVPTTYSFSANNYGSDGIQLFAGTQVIPHQPVTGTPGTSQYSVNTVGVYTFPGSSAGLTVTINYSYSIPDSSGSTTSPTTLLSLNVFTGTQSQSPWGYMSSAHPDRALGYTNRAYIGAPNLDLGSSATLPNYTFEVGGLLQFGAGIVDANPAAIVDYIIAHPANGTTFPSANIGDLTQYSNYCVANGLFLSPKYDSQQYAGNIIDQLMTLTNSECFYSEGLLKVVPYGDVTAVGNGATYTPNTTPIYDLSDTDFIAGHGEEPITISIIAPEDQYNVTPLEILDRSNNYNTLPIQATDFAAIATYGTRQANSLTAHECCDSTTGMVIAGLINKHSAYVTRNFKFKIGLRYCLLEPMDLVTVTDPLLGLNKYPVRILKIEEDDTNTFSITAEEFPWGTATSTEYPAQSPSSFSPYSGVDPGNVHTPIIFEATNGLSQYDGSKIYIGASGGTNWGGCSVWASADGTTFQQVGRITEPCRMGVLTATLATSATSVDTTSTLSVDVSESRAVLNSGTASDCDNFRDLCYVDGELISYQTATLTGTYAYNIGIRMQRGVYGSPISSHAIGSSFLRLDNSVFQYTYDSNWVAGQVIYLKFTSFNSYGSNEQPLSGVTAYSFTIVGNHGAINPGSGNLLTGTPTYPVYVIDTAISTSGEGTGGNLLDNGDCNTAAAVGSGQFIAGWYRKTWV